MYAREYSLKIKFKFYFSCELYHFVRTRDVHVSDFSSPPRIRAGEEAGGEAEGAGGQGEGGA